MAVRVHTWSKNALKDQTLGKAHASMEVESQSFGEQYVTWLSSRTDEAHASVGFKKIIYKEQEIERNRRGLFQAGGLDTESAINRKMDINSELQSYRAPLFTHRETDIPVMKHDETEFKFGVDPTMIAIWWDAKLSLPPGAASRKYSYYSTELNCVSIVMEGLLYGGLGNYARFPNNWMCNTAIDLNAWVLRATTEINRLNNQSRDPVIYSRLYQKAVLFSFTNLDLPELRQWKSESNEKVYNPFARRTEQIANIDKLIQEYHAIPPESNPMRKECLLLQIFNNGMIHMTNKPKSDRATAVHDIACNALGVYLRERVELSVNLRNSTSSSDSSTQFSLMIGQNGRGSSFD